MKYKYLVCKSSIILILLSLCLVFSSCIRISRTYKIFGSLDEFSCFDSFEPEEIPDWEELVQGLDIKERRCFQVFYSGIRYEVYAYVFGTSDDAATFSSRFSEHLKKPFVQYGSYYNASYQDRALLYIGESASSDFPNYLFDHLSAEINL